MPTNDLDGLLHKPLAALRDILLFRRQPYLASVLPMYAFFALLVPLTLPLARTQPWLLLAFSGSPGTPRRTSRAFTDRRRRAGTSIRSHGSSCSCSA